MHASCSIYGLLLGTVALLASALLHGQVPGSAYRVETLPGPRGIAPEVSALAFGDDGKLYATFRRGYIYSFDPRSNRWKRFAEGLHTPLGILPGERSGEFLSPRFLS